MDFGEIMLNAERVQIAKMDTMERTAAGSAIHDLKVSR
jgi:hypothetical protein